MTSTVMDKYDHDTGICVVNLMLNTWGVFYYDFNSDDFKNWTDTRYCPEGSGEGSGLNLFLFDQN